MRKRYLVWIALAFLFGILQAEQRSCIFAVCLLLLVGMIVAQFVRADCKKQALLISLALFVSFTTGALRWQFEQNQKETYASLLTDGRSVQLQGKLYKKETKQKTNLLYLKNCYLKAGNQIYQTQDFVVYHDNISYPLGNILCVKGEVKELQKPKNEGGFDEKTFYESQMIVGKIYADSVKVAEGTPNVYQEGLFAWKQKIRQVYEACMPKEEAGAMSAIALGEKSAMDQEIKQLYQSSGISHILSISGLHISLIGMFLFQFLRKRGVSYMISSSVALAVVYSFGTLSGLSLSTKRAVLMFAVYLVAQVFGQAYDSLTALAVAAVILLFQNPFLLHNTAFQFSFLAVFAASELYPLFDTGKRWSQSFFLCVSVQAVTIPITMWNYYEIPTYVVLINLCVLPFVGILLGCGLIGGFVGCVWLSGADVILKGSEWILEGYTFFMECTKKLPCAIWITGKPSGWMLFIYYLILVVIILVLKYRKEQFRWQMIDAEYAPTSEREQKEKELAHLKRTQRIWQYGATSTLFLAILVLCMNPQKKELEVDILDVGQGDGIYFSNSGGTSMFMDGGSSSVKQVGEYRILPFLKSKGIRNVSYWFVSHTDEDHISGLIEVLQSGYPVDYLILAKHRGEGENESELLQAAKEAGTKVAFIDAGQQMKCEDMTIRCLFPDAGFTREDLNARSLVLEVQEGDFSGIFTGDIPQESEEYILQKRNVSPVLFYKAAHHGSKTSNSEIFLNALQPKVSVASAGKDNRYGHPAEEAVKRMEEAGSVFLSTMDTGRIRIRLCSDGLLVEKYGKPLETRIVPVVD